jgi:hypothetical protein
VASIKGDATSSKSGIDKSQGAFSLADIWQEGVNYLVLDIFVRRQIERAGRPFYKGKNKFLMLRHIMAGVDGD